ncbi:MAG TPA: hypothetical protein VNK43_10200 [Gemmatimonadales bacterium]|nr:hypothetical protein [Gemmatimonadales bacterium]
MRYEETLRDHSLMREGLAVGLLAGTVVAAWFLLGDALTGRFLVTPSQLGQYLLQGDETPSRAVEPGAVAGYAFLHFVGFVVAGWLAAWLTHLTVRSSAWRVGIPSIVLVVAIGAVGVLAAVRGETGGRLPMWSIGVALVLGAVTMIVYLWRTHPVIGRQLRDVPLGDTQDREPS